MIKHAPVLFLLMVLPFCLRAETVVQLDNGPFELREGWHFSFTDLRGTEKGELVDLPVEPDPEGRKYPEIWLRKEFFLPEGSEGRRLYLLLGKRWGAVQVFVNGVEVLKHGSFYPEYHYHEARRVNAPISAGLLRYGGVNRLLIRYGPEADRTLVTPPALGYEEDYWYHEKLVNFINVELYRYLAFLSLFVALFYFMQYFVRPKEGNNLTFALVNIGFTIYLARLGYSFPSLPLVPFFAFSKAVFFPVFALMTFFVARYLESSGLKKLMPYLWTAAMVSFFSILLFGTTTLRVDNIFAVSLIFVVVEIVAMAVITLRAHQRGVPDTLPMVAGILLSAAVSAHDIFYMMIRVYPDWWIQGLALFIFDMGVFASLAVRSMRLHSELERYSEMIEQKVMDRTRELQWANVDLQNAMEAAHHASQAKSRFLANISHEMRTPLNCIIGFSEMISRTADPRQQKNLDVVLDESERLLTLINQLLDIEKIEAGKISLNTAPFDVKELLNSIITSFAVHCAEKGLELRLETTEDVPRLIKADSFRLRQVLDNLISNAVKFTLHGGVTLEVSVHQRDDERHVTLYFAVSDTGIGIPKEQSELIFESFEQGDSGRTRLYGGTGLGTTIAKQLVSLMTGNIGVESEVGRGSLFWFTLPCDIVEDDESPHKVVPNLAVEGRIEGSPRVLVVEDYRLNRVIARSHLESAGCRVVEAADGREAVKLVDSQDFDLVLMDVQMPEMDGLEATGLIRDNLNKKELIILGLTANAYPEDLKQYRAAGMNGVLTKPLRRERFLLDIASWLSGTGPSGQVTPEAESAGGVCDIDALTMEMEDSREAALQMLHDFTVELEGHFDRIEGALHKRDWPLLHRELHTIKGGALNLFAHTMARAAAEAEAAAKEEHEQRVRDLLPALRSAAAALRDFAGSTSTAIRGSG